MVRPGGAKACLALAAALVALSACQTIDQPAGHATGGYPTLRSVPPLPDADFPVEQRREIARELITDRDKAQYDTKVVRHRSGLSDVPPSATAEQSAEDIIRDLPQPDDPSLAEGLDSGEDPDAIYPNKTLFEDGGLSDFIRKLKRDTAPKPAEPDEEDDDDTAAVRPLAEAPRLLADDRVHAPSTAGRLDIALVRTIAPARRTDDGMVAIRLAAADEEPGFFCSYLGWLVAWSTACVPDDPDPSANGVTADVESDGPSPDPRAKGATDPGEDDATDGAETNGVDGNKPTDDGAGDDALPSTASAMDALRDFFQTRSGSPRPPDENSLAYQAEELRPVEQPQPWIPTFKRPIRQDLEIVADGRQFVFHRTPRPAFKPLPPWRRPQLARTEIAARPEAPATARLPARPPRTDSAARIVPRPKPQPTARDDVPDRPDVVVTRRQADPGQSLPAAPPGTTTAPAALSPSAPPATDTAPGTDAPDQDRADAVLDRMVITFAPQSEDLPSGAKARLGRILADAKVRNAQIHIVGEAPLLYLAHARARVVGLALVQLGATADLLEFDIADNGVADQVTLLLKPTPDDPLVETTNQAK